MSFRRTTSQRVTTPSARFLHAYADTLTATGRRALWIRPKKTVAWREADGSLNYAYLLRWFGERAQDTPQITRVMINHYAFTPSRRTLLLLGYDMAERPVRREDLHLELTLLDRELAAFATWLPLWLAGRIDPSRAIPEPPHACHNWREDWRTTDYAWSAAAWEANRAWRAREEAREAASKARREAARAGIAGHATSPDSAEVGTA